MATDCVEWHRAKTRAGYGVRWDRDRVKYVHRITMEQHLGRDLASGEVVMHSCDNPSCYNIEHLSLGTTADNVADMHNKGRNAKGFMLPHTKLSERDVARIRALRKSGARNKDVAALFNVHQSHVSKITADTRRIA